MALTSHILMIRPVHFAFNEQTAVNNSFQIKPQTNDAQQHALQEFDAFVSLLRANFIDVTVVDDTPDPHTPDSIFPNNWISFHETGDIILYPMFAANRRLERKPSVMSQIKSKFKVGNIIDFSRHESNNTFLEGTGSMVLDRSEKLAYACLSPRTDSGLVNEFCEVMGYTPVIFEARDAGGKAIYHTNVLMCVGDSFVVICLDVITDIVQKTAVEQAIRLSGKTIVLITPEQMTHFAGNMLQVKNSYDEPFLIMSTAAYESLSRPQRKMLEQFCKILHSPLGTIEANGGGSARCMMAEVFLPVL
jgi:hypothetical protein